MGYINPKSIEQSFNFDAHVRPKGMRNIFYAFYSHVQTRDRIPVGSSLVFSC